MNPKIILITGAAVAAMAIALFLFSEDGLQTPVSQAPIPVAPRTNAELTMTGELVQNPAAAIPESEPEPQPVVVADPVLNTLYDSTDFALKLAAARQIAARGNESSFRAIASVLMATEMTGESTNRTLAKELAEVLQQMRGPQIQAIAVELAYSPSSLLSEAATDAAIASEPTMHREELAAGTGGKVSPQTDAAAQAILDEEIANKPITD